MRDARRAKLPGKGVSARFRVALVGQKLAPRQILEQRFEIVLAPGVSLKLAGEFCAAMLTPREQPQGALAQRRLLFHTSAVTGANACGPLTPSFSRIFASISSARSGFSLR